MTLEAAIELLPDEALVPVGWVRAMMLPPEVPEPSYEERLIAAWVHEGTKNIRTPGRRVFGGTPSETRE